MRGNDNVSGLMTSHDTTIEINDETQERHTSIKKMTRVLTYRFKYLFSLSSIFISGYQSPPLMGLIEDFSDPLSNIALSGPSDDGSL